MWTVIFKYSKNLKYFSHLKNLRLLSHKMDHLSAYKGLNVKLKIFVVSQIPKMTKTFRECAPNGIEVIAVNLPDEDEALLLNDIQCDLLKEAEVVVADPKVIANNFACLPSLKWVYSTFAGVEPILNMFSRQPHFVITRHSGMEFCTLMAEYCVSHIFNCERRAKVLWKSQELKEWNTSECVTVYRPLHELTIGILGTGNMGSTIAKFVFDRGATVFGYSRSGIPKDYFNCVSTSLEEVICRSDYIINTLPSTDETCGLLKASHFEKCTKASVFINVGRGNVIKEEELISALNNKWLSGAVLDVFENEPLAKSSPLWEISNVTITPHLSALSRPKHIADEFFKSLLLYLNDSDLPNQIRWDVGY